jgi:anti-anti-sigma factor
MHEQTSFEIQDGTLSLRVLEEGTRRVLSLAGELDLANAGTLAAQLEQGTEGEVVLDMTELEFIDSTGIALLVATHRRLNRAEEVCFRLVGSESAAVRRVMALTGLDAELPFSGDGHLEPDPGAA